MNKQTNLEVAELTMYLPFQDSAFTVRGADETLEDLAADLQAHDKRRNARSTNRTARRGKRVLEASTHVTGRVLGRVATDLKAKAFDFRHNTNLYDQLQEKRENEKIVRMGVELGLISLTDTVCQRHAHAVDQLKG